MTQRTTPNEEPEELVNDATPTNAPGPTPADNTTGSSPDDRGKTTQTGDAGDVPESVRRTLKDDRKE